MSQGDDDAFWAAAASAAAAAERSAGRQSFQRLLEAHAAPPETGPPGPPPPAPAAPPPPAPTAALAAREPRAVARWEYPQSVKFPKRSYQLEMAGSCLRDNTLVCLPTGLGKTFVAAVVMYNFFRWHPEHKVVFLAPTKPLVAQQVEACYNIMNIPYSDISEMTGNTNPARRIQEWREKRCFFVTPQVLVNDLNRGSVPAESIRCLIVDEAHRATGNYAYVQVVRLIESRNKMIRIVGLTATPASTPVGVQAVIDNLLISRLQVRSDDDIDVRQYVHTKTVEKIAVKMPPHVTRICEAIGVEMHKHLSFLCSQKAFYQSDPARAPMYALMQAQQAWAAQMQAAQHANNGVPSNKNAGMIFTAFSKARLLAQMRQLLLVHGLQSFVNFCEAKKDDESSKKTIKTFTNSLEFGQMYGLAQKAVREGKLHPKATVLKQLMLDHFEKDPDSRVIIFTSLRDSVDSIVQIISGIPLVKVSRFVGQANKGQKQSEQLEVVSHFRKGLYNTLVATCVGEEGLDVGECDLIVLFDSSASPIRTMQRMGRTGRKRQGRCVVLVSEGQEEKTYDTSKSRGNNILRSLINKKDSYCFHKPKEEDVEGLVPGRIREPVYIESAPPVVSMSEARAQRRRDIQAARTGTILAKTSQAKAEYLMEKFDISEYDLTDSWPDDSWLKTVLDESFSLQIALDPVVEVHHSCRTELIRYMNRFAGTMDTVSEYGGVDVHSLASSAASNAILAPPTPEPSPAKRKKKLPRASIYLDDSDEEGGSISLSISDDVDIFRGRISSVQREKTKTQKKKKRAAAENDDDGDDDDDDDELHQPSSVWFNEPEDSVRRVAGDEDDDDNDLYEPSDLWFNNPAGGKQKHREAEEGQNFIAPEQPMEAVQRQDKEQQDPQLCGNVVEVSRQRVPPQSPIVLDVIDSPPPRSALNMSPIQPARKTPSKSHLFKSPLGTASSGATPAKRYCRATDGASKSGIDLSVISPHMREVLRNLPSNAPTRGLFFPAPPAFCSEVASITTECPSCRMVFRDVVALGLHCFDRHWSTTRDSLPVYNPLPNRASSLQTVAASVTSRPLSVEPCDNNQHNASRSITPSPAPPAQVSQSFMASSSSSSAVKSAEPSEFEVEKILDQRVQDGVLEFLVRWKGYNTQHQTWEPEKHLLPGCKQLIGDFIKEADRKRELEAATAKKARPQRRRKRTNKAEIAFLDIEAGVSGSEGSSDEEEDEASQRPSWVVDDEDDIIYSGTPPSQPLDDDIGFYRRAFNNDSDSYVMTPVQPQRRPKKAKSKPTARPKKRLLKRAVVQEAAESDGIDDVIVGTPAKSQAFPPPPQRSVPSCAVCNGPVSSDTGPLCGVCQSGMAMDDVFGEPAPVASAKLIAATREISTKLVSGLTKIGINILGTVIECHDADYILSRSTSCLVWHEKALKNGTKIVREAVRALELNSEVIGIVEWDGQGRSTEQYERAVSRLAMIPGLRLLFSSGADHSAFLIKSLHDGLNDRFCVSIDWLNEKQGQLTFLTRFHRVGVSRAMALLLDFKTLRAVVCASVEELHKTLGPGSGDIAKELHRQFNAKI